MQNERILLLMDEISVDFEFLLRYKFRVNWSTQTTFDRQKCASYRGLAAEDICLRVKWY